MTGASTSGFAVLFVDDEEKARKYFRMAFTRDFRVLTASGVSEAREILEREAGSIGVLITDQRMPGGQGVDLLRLARERWPGIVRMLTTAYSDLDDAIAAVNNGEILRYITKPWDVAALRLELRQAMELFELRRERDLLLAEKYSVRQRMVQADRLRGLLALGAGLEHLRHGAHALSAWLRDGLEGHPQGATTDAALELWGLHVAETLALVALQRRLHDLDAQVPAGFADVVEPAHLLSAAPSVTGKVPSVRGSRGLLERLGRALGASAAPGTSARLQQGSMGEAAVDMVLLSVDLDPSVRIGFGGTGAGGDLLEAYLIAWHHGGSLRRRDRGAGGGLDLTLPADPGAIALPEADSDWIAAQFGLLECWD